MILGALLDAGVTQEKLQEQLSLLHLEGFDLKTRRVMKNGLSATQAEVIVADPVPERRLPDLIEIIHTSELTPPVKEQAVAIFQRLGQVEAHIHGISLEQVHLHELGGLDTIVDVVGALAGLQLAGVEQVQVSALPLGRGFIKSSHGPLPLPAPATVALLDGVPVTGSDLEVELVTPTGAAILTSLATSFGPIPAMTFKAVGYGAGRRDLPIPNVLRILLGESAAPEAAIIETLAMLETNIDDLNPEVYEYVMAQLFDAGALDVFLSPIQMKKNRPAVLLRVLCKTNQADALSAILFSETSTLGIRKQLIERHCLPRTIQSVSTLYGPVRIKIAQWGQGKRKIAPEYEDCKKIAALKKVPLWEVYQAAIQAAQEIF